MQHSDQVAFDVMHCNIITWSSGNVMQSISTVMGVRHSQLVPFMNAKNRLELVSFEPHLVFTSCKLIGDRKAISC